MEIEQFIAQSEGEWRSMRSGHSLAFQQFEQIISHLAIKILDRNDSRIIDLLKSNNISDGNYISPFHMKWESETDWDHNHSSQISSGSTILIPFPKTKVNGLLLRSQGYAEPIESLSTYHFLNDGTFILNTPYQKTIAEERIWFLSEKVRSRSSVIYTDKRLGIIQTSFTSEIKLSNRHENA